MVKEDEREEMSEYMYTLLEPNTCNPSPCGAHGNCAVATISSGTVVICICNDQWTGRRCDTQMGGE